MKSSFAGVSNKKRLGPHREKEKGSFFFIFRFSICLFVDGGGRYIPRQVYSPRPTEFVSSQLSKKINKFEMEFSSNAFQGFVDCDCTGI